MLITRAVIVYYLCALIYMPIRGFLLREWSLSLADSPDNPVRALSLVSYLTHLANCFMHAHAAQ